MKIIITEEQLNTLISDGVGDKYAENQFHIPNTIDTFTSKDEEDIIVVKREDNHAIIKNPKSPDSIGRGARGIIDKHGDLYIEDVSIDLHDFIVDYLCEINILNPKYMDTWSRDNPEVTGFITVVHKGGGNIYVGDSHWMWTVRNDMNDNEIIQLFKSFMDKAAIRNPRFNFIPQFSDATLNEDTETINPDINFKLNFKNRITDHDYYQLRRETSIEFDVKEQAQLSLLFKDYRQAFNRNTIYPFKYSKRTFGEPAIEFYGFIHKFKSYYLVDLRYEIQLPHAKGKDNAFGMFNNFDELLKFFRKLISLEIQKNNITESQLNNPYSIKNEEDYHGYHTAPGPGSDDSPLYEVSDKFGDDIYGKQALRIFGGYGDYDRFSIAIIQHARNKPNMPVKIYRAVPKIITTQEKINDYQNRMKEILRRGKLPRDVNNWKNPSEYYDWLDSEIKRLESEPQEEEKVKINVGDWVTINYQYAKEHGQSNLDNKFRILTKTCTAKDIYTDGNSIHEWGYYPANQLNEDTLENKITFKKVRTFKTEEGNFAIYDTQPEDQVRDRACMFTVFESPDGWIVRNSIVPEDLRRKGLATNFYIKMNKLSKQQTGNPLRSTQPRTLSTGEVVHELSNDGIQLWDSFVTKGLAKKFGHKNYSFI